MSIDEIREKYLEEKGKVEGIEFAKKVFKLLNKGESISCIAKICGISERKVKEIKSFFGKLRTPECLTDCQ